MMVKIECQLCAGAGFTRRDDWPGARVWCGRCAGTGGIDYPVGCEHEWGLSGYGTVEDPQWDGAWQCDECEAVFADWPRQPSSWHPVDPTGCECGHRRAAHRHFSDSCVACGCERYLPVVVTP